MEKILSSLAVISALLRFETGYAVVKSQHFQVSALSAFIRGRSWFSWGRSPEPPLIYLIQCQSTSYTRSHQNFPWENLPRRVRRARRSRTRGPMRIEIYFCGGWEWSSRIRWLPPCSLGDIFWVHPSRSFKYGLALMNLIPAHPSYLLDPEEFF